MNPNLMPSYLEASALSHHFAKHCMSFSNSREVRQFIRENLDVEIIWKGNMVKTLKQVGTASCQLCMKERHNILNAWRGDKFRLLNNRTEIFGACSCKSRFCWFIENSGH